MIKLKSVTETVIKVDYNDLDKFIQEVTGQKGYECVAAEEWSNDSQHRFNVEDNPLDVYDSNRWEAFKSGKGEHSYMLQTILDGMCVEKLIPRGTYFIRVSW